MKERELISSEEAKLAWANGDHVLYKNIDGIWRNLNDTDFYSSIFCNKNYSFKLKPRTITINGIEVPAPFKPKDGEVCFVLSNFLRDGYMQFIYPTFEQHVFQFGAWRNEEEIKQVVVALREVFK